MTMLCIECFRFGYGGLQLQCTNCYLIMYSLLSVLLWQKILNGCTRYYIYNQICNMFIYLTTLYCVTRLKKFYAIKNTNQCHRIAVFPVLSLKEKEKTLVFRKTNIFIITFYHSHILLYKFSFPSGVYSSLLLICYQFLYASITVSFLLYISFIVESMTYSI